MTKVFRRLHDALRKVFTLDGEKVREDLRKLGMTFIPGGVLAMLLPPANVGTGYGLIVLVLGLVCWMLGVRKLRKKKEVQHVHSTRSLRIRRGHADSNDRRDVVVVRRRG